MRLNHPSSRQSELFSLYGNFDFFSWGKEIVVDGAVNVIPLGQKDMFGDCSLYIMAERLCMCLKICSTNYSL